MPDLPQIHGGNYSAAQPLTPRFAVPIEAWDVNLMNCLLPEGSILHGCQKTQQIRYFEVVELDGESVVLEEERRILVGKGVVGEVTEEMVLAAWVTLPQDAVEGS